MLGLASRAPPLGIRYRPRLRRLTEPCLPPSGRVCPQCHSDASGYLRQGCPHPRKVQFPCVVIQKLPRIIHGNSCPLAGLHKPEDGSDTRLAWKQPFPQPRDPITFFPIHAKTQPLNEAIDPPPWGIPPCPPARSCPHLIPLIGQQVQHTLCGVHLGSIGQQVDVKDVLPLHISPPPPCSRTWQ